MSQTLVIYAVQKVAPSYHHDILSYKRNGFAKDMEQFPGDLLFRYKVATGKLKKFQRVLFKRFAPNVAEVSDEFNQLAVSFNNSFLPQYAGLCWLGAAKCEKALGNVLSEVDYLLKSARASIEADQKEENLRLLSNDRCHLEAALRCYNQALDRLDDDSVMKAAIIREIKKIQPHSDITSSFVSPAHRIFDLEVSADISVKCADFVAALEKRTEIYDNIAERNVQSYYTDVLKRNEVSRILLLLLLELPKSRHSPSHMKLMEQFNEACDVSVKLGLSAELNLTLKELVRACQDKNSADARHVLAELSLFHSLTKEDHMILQHLEQKYVK